MRITIHIYYYLFQEIRIVILGIHIQRLAKNRNVSRHARSVIPRFLLIQMRGNLHFTAACQKIVILRQYMIGTVSLTGRQTKMQILIRIILDVCTRCYKETMFAAVIPSDTPININWSFRLNVYCTYAPGTDSFTYFFVNPSSTRFVSR